MFEKMSFLATDHHELDLIRVCVLKHNFLSSKQTIEAEGRLHIGAQFRMRACAERRRSAMITSQPGNHEFAHG